MTTDQLDAIIDVVAYSDFPGLILTEWARARECAERGIDPQDDFENYFENLSAETGLDFAAMDVLAKRSDRYWNMVTRFKSLIS